MLRRFELCLLMLFLLGNLAVARVRGQESLADVIERCERSVVKIDATERTGQESIGSGFVVESNGTIVTNYHVLAGAKTATATFADGRKFEITGIRHMDRARDIAIARIEASGLPSLMFSAAQVRKGEQVSALGCPVGLSFSATNGIVSSVRAAAELGESLKGTWIQVDAALSPGNSGGPLINSRGEVVGMSTLASTNGLQNINFGISAEDIQDALASSSSAVWQPLSRTAMMAKPSERRLGESPAEGEITLEPIAPEALADYARRTKEDMERLKRELRLESVRQAGILSDMQRGRAYFTRELQIRFGREDVAQHGLPGKKPIWHFKDESVKAREVTKQSKLVANLQRQLEASNSSDLRQALYGLMTSFGPSLETQREGTIGFMKGAVVRTPLGRHTASVVYEKMPYLMLMHSTAGLFPGQQVADTPVLVKAAVGFKVEDIRGVVTVLQQVSQDEIRQWMFDDSSPPSASPSEVVSGGSRQAGTDSIDDILELLGGSNLEYRTWTDRTGRFKVEAAYLETQGSEVSLKRRDSGQTIRIAMDKLSDTDRDFLRTRSGK